MLRGLYQIGYIVGIYGVVTEKQAVLIKLVDPVCQLLGLLWPIKLLRRYTHPAKVKTAPRTTDIMFFIVAPPLAGNRLTTTSLPWFQNFRREQAS